MNNTTERCTTCGNHPTNPFRVYNERGHVTSGCIDECHTGRLVVPSESAHWHNRPYAKKYRAWTKARLRAMFAGKPIPSAPTV